MKDVDKLYWKLLPLAYNLYYELYGKPNSHFEYMNGFNIRGKIVRTLIDEQKKENTTKF